MQAFILKRDEVDGIEVQETTAIDQALMKVFKDRDQVLAAIKLGYLKEGEIFGTIDDDESNETSQDQLRSLQEQLRELQGQTSDIASILPEDVGSDNLLETVQSVLTKIQALDAANKGGAGKYIESISETDGTISAVEKSLVSDITTVSPSVGDLPPMARAVRAAIDVEKDRATSAESDLADEVDTLKTNFNSLVTSKANASDLDDEITNRQTAITTEVTNRNSAITSAINTEVTNRNTAITNAINALDKSDTAVAGQYVSAVSETDGKITVTRASLPSIPTFSLSGSTLTITV